MKIATDPYGELANAIIIQAVDDYKTALKDYKKAKSDKDRDNIKYRLRPIESFFKSDWYSLLTNVDGEMIIKRIREQIGVVIA